MSLNKNFYWGGAVAAHQCEGAWDIHGKGASLCDHLTGGSLNEPRLFTEQIDANLYYPSHEAIDMYHHYIDDIHLFAEMGFKMFRMSVNWARIYPTGEEKTPNAEGIAFYRKIFEELKKNHIEPLVTISHFEMPYHLCKKYRGWADARVINLYVKYCRTLFEEYKGLVRYWIPFNEINNGTTTFASYLCLGIPLQDHSPMFDTSPQNAEKTNEIYQALHHQLVANAKVVKLGHEIDPAYQFGCMVSGRPFYPNTCDPHDVIKAEKLFQEDIYYFIDVMARGAYPYYSQSIWKEKGIMLNISEEDKQTLRQGKIDFVSFSYYSSSCASADPEVNKNASPIFKGVQNPYLESTEWGWDVDPQGLRYLLNELYGRYQLPLMIVENGLGARDELTPDKKIHDLYRIHYMKKHIEAIKQAADDGVDVIAYTCWGCIDLISASTGEMDKRYGLIYVDKNNNGQGTLKRYPKDSFYWYKNVIASNGERLD